MKLTPNQVVDALRKCGNTIVCGGCPYQGVPGCRIRLLRDAATVIETLHPNGSGWIDVDKRRPDAELERVRSQFGEGSVQVIVLILGATLSTTLEYDGEGFKDDSGHPYRVVKWMPMPEI